MSLFFERSYLLCDVGCGVPCVCCLCVCVWCVNVKRVALKNLELERLFMSVCVARKERGLQRTKEQRSRFCVLALLGSDIHCAVFHAAFILYI